MTLFNFTWFISLDIQDKKIHINKINLIYEKKKKIDVPIK